MMLHLEGICGSGKTTSAETLCECFITEGHAARWYLEESKDHPVTPSTIRRRPKDGDFSAALLRSWSDFLARTECAGCYHILEGYAFQSTVRFMLEYLRPRSEIDAYFARWVELGLGRNQLVYFYVDDVARHMESALPLKGGEWVSKVTLYIEGTPYGQQHLLRGLGGFVEFWARYQDLCVDLLSCADIQHEIVPAKTRRWTVADVPVLIDRFPTRGGGR
jgi:hypothetical protein